MYILTWSGGWLLQPEKMECCCIYCKTLSLCLHWNRRFLNCIIGYSHRLLLITFHCAQFVKETGQELCDKPEEYVRLSIQCSRDLSVVFTWTQWTVLCYKTRCIKYVNWTVQQMLKDTIIEMLLFNHSFLNIFIWCVGECVLNYLCHIVGDYVGLLDKWR